MAAKPKSKSMPAAQEILRNAQSSRQVIQDFVPLAESLEWELGQQYLKDRGNKAFISDASPVPFVINNDGTLSRNAAEVFFASLQAADEEGTLTEPTIFVLELGIGVGLFARFFLDHFQELCQQHGKDYYDRFCYIAADRSERMLVDVLRHGVLSRHPGRYRVRLVDAMKPEERLPHDLVFLNYPHKPFRAVFLNYLLDCLPAAVLDLSGEPIKQLCVRTCLARNIRLDDYTDMTLNQLQERAKSKEPSVRQELLEVYGLFASEYDYRAVDAKTLPYGDFVLDFARSRTNRVLHSYGAIQALEKLLDLLNDSGFILINDYGQTKIERDDDFEHQRFSLATFVGVNFPLLNSYFRDHRRCSWQQPLTGETAGIHTRLLSSKPALGTGERFQECFSASAQQNLQEPLAKARHWVKAGRFEVAATYYNQALEKQPRNWVLMNEISMFLTFSLRDPKAGIDMAKVALDLNPACSAELWSTLGDGLYEWGRTAEARGCYEKALKVNASDVRSRFNLAWVYTREKDYRAALRSIADAMSLDKTGEYRDRLMQKLQEVTTHLSLRHQQEYLLLINLVSKYAKPEGDKGKPDDEVRVNPITPQHSA